MSEMQCMSMDAGEAWASSQLPNESTNPITVIMNFRGNVVHVQVLPSDPVLVGVEELSGHGVEVDPSFVKVVFKGKRLDPNASFAAQGVGNAAKLMVLASSPTEIEKVRSSRSDPTVRGFSGEKALEAQRNRLKGVASSSPWREEQDKEYKFSKLEVVHFEPPVVPHPFATQSLLLKLATDPGIVACMKSYKWSVGKLAEMDPSDDKLKKQEGSCTLGYNENGGARIFVRLRTDDLRDLRPYRQLVNTLIHELCHNAFGPHTEPFWRLFAHLKTLYLKTHGSLQQEGVIVAGKSMRSLADLSGDAQDVAGSIRSELSASFANAALAPNERAAAARVAAEQDALAAESAAAAQRSSASGSMSIGSSSGEVLNPRAAAAAAAERRRLAAEATAAETMRGSPLVARDEEPKQEIVEVVESSVMEQAKEANDNEMVLEEPQGSTIENPTTRVMGATGEALQSSSATAPAYTAIDNDLSKSTPAPAVAIVEEEVPSTPPVLPVPPADEALPSTLPPTPLASPPALPEASTQALGTLSKSSSPPSSTDSREEPKNPWASSEGEISSTSSASIGVSSDNSSSSSGSSSHLAFPTSAPIAEPNSREARLQRAVNDLKSTTPPSAEAKGEAVVALQEVASRVLAEPQESKYRKLRRGNKRFARTIGASPSAMEWLQAVGFKEGDENDLILPPGADLGLLWLGRELLTGS